MRRLRATRDRGDAVDTASVAVEVHRLAVLLQAGVPPTRALHHVSEGADRGDRPPEDIPAALDGRGGAWRDVATAWRVAATVGAPLAPSLRGVAETLRDADATRDAVSVALAEPATTARLISWLPVLAVVLVVAFGFDLVGVLAQPLGMAVLGAGAFLTLIARRWTAALIRAAQPAPGTPGWECDLVAVALTGGVSIDRALAVVEGAGCPDVSTAVDDVLALSRRTGAPAVELLRAEARDRRRRARTDGRLRAARLGGRLLLPLGACTLPAFLLLGVGPMLLAVLSGSAVAF